MTTKFEQTHIAMVLDRSGSMGSCRKATIDAVNKYLLEARQDAALKEADFSLKIFDSQSIDEVRSGVIINVKDLAEVDFQPRGGTPLYDAVGRGIDDLDGKLVNAGSGKAILVIVTDGEENSSRRHTHASISELIKARQGVGWLIVFLGAGLDAARQGIAMGIRAASTASIAMNEQALGATMSSVRGMSSGYAARPLAEAMDFAATASFSAGERRSMGDATAGADLLGAQQAPGGAPTPSVDTPAAPQADAFTSTTDAWSN